MRHRPFRSRDTQINQNDCKFEQVRSFGGATGFDDTLLLLNWSPGSRGSLATTRGPCLVSTTFNVC